MIRPLVMKIAGSLPASSAIRIFGAGPQGIAVGIKTAMSASMLFGVSAWPCIYEVKE